MTDPHSVPPITISFMLACFATPIPEQYVLGKWNSEAGIRTRRWLQDNGLIDDDYQATDKGTAWVEAICSTPLPVAQWVMPERDRAGDVVFADAGVAHVAIPRYGSLAVNSEGKHEHAFGRHHRDQGSSPP